MVLGDVSRPPTTSISVIRCGGLNGVSHHEPCGIAQAGLHLAHDQS